MTHLQQIDNHLSQGFTLTPFEAQAKFGTFRLAARIKELRNMGREVVTHTMAMGRKRWAQYSYKHAFRSGDLVTSTSDSPFGTYSAGSTGRVVEVNHRCRTMRIRWHSPADRKGEESWVNCERFVRSQFDGE